jgi:transcription antitermination factor NusG
MADSTSGIENHLDPKEPRWFAVYTRSKSEKAAFRSLSRKGIEVYLPLRKHTRRYTRKIRTVELPLITCYIFVRIRKDEYVRVLETENVVGFVKFAKNLISIPEEEIDILKRVLGEGWEVTAERTDHLVRGDRVEVAAGSLFGLQGTLVEDKDKHQVLVELERMGYSLRIQIDRSLLMKVP